MHPHDDDRALRQYRRLLLQRRLRRASDSEAFRQVAGGLRMAGLRFARMSPTSVRSALGDLTLVPGKDERIDWSRIRSAECRCWTDDLGRDDLFREAVAACAKPHERVAVIWHTHASGLRIAAQDLASHVSPVLDAGSEIWVCSADGAGSWLVEYARYGGEICFGTSLLGEGHGP